MKKDQRGLTLVELVVVIAILGIMAVVLGIFVTSGSSNFRIVSANTTLQMKEQQLTEDLQNLIIDCNSSLNLYTGGAMDPELGTGEDSSSAEKSLEIYRVQDVSAARPGGGTAFEKTGSCDTIQWDPAAGEITWKKKTRNLETDTDTFLGETELLADHVTSFGIDLSGAQNDGIVKFTFTLEEQGRSRSASCNVTLRNQVLVNQEEFPYGSDDTGGTVTITLLPREPIASGKTVQLNYVITGKVSSNEVAWEITGWSATVSTHKIDENGRLTVNGNGVVTVKVTALGDPSQEKASATQTYEVS